MSVAAISGTLIFCQERDFIRKHSTVQYYYCSDRVKYVSMNPASGGGHFASPSLDLSLSCMGCTPSRTDDPYTPHAPRNQLWVYKIAIIIHGRRTKKEEILPRFFSFFFFAPAFVLFFAGGGLIRELSSSLRMSGGNSARNATSTLPDLRALAWSLGKSLVSEASLVLFLVGPPPISETMAFAPARRKEDTIGDEVADVDPDEDCFSSARICAGSSDSTASSTIPLRKASACIRSRELAELLFFCRLSSLWDERGRESPPTAVPGAVPADDPAAESAPNVSFV